MSGIEYNLQKGAESLSNAKNSPANSDLDMLYPKMQSELDMEYIPPHLQTPDNGAGYDYSSPQTNVFFAGAGQPAAFNGATGNLVGPDGIVANSAGAMSSYNGLNLHGYGANSNSNYNTTSSYSFNGVNDNVVGHTESVGNMAGSAFPNYNGLNLNGYSASSNHNNANYGVYNLANDSSQSVNALRANASWPQLNENEGHSPEKPASRRDRYRPKSAHNVIEQRYRNKINDKFTALQNLVPTLRVIAFRKTKHRDGEREDDDSDEDDYLPTSDHGENLEGLEPARKLNKGTILAKSIEYIKFLERKNDRIKLEHSQLLERARMLGIAVDESLLEGMGQDLK